MIKNLHFLNKYLIYLSSLLIFCVACNTKNEQTVVSTSTPVAAVVKKDVKPLQKAVSSSLRLPPPTVNQFDFSGKKDPFKPFIAAKVELKSTAENSKLVLKNSLPIHSYDVSQFRLIGIVTGGRENQAMVTDPNGKGYVIRAGMSIGKNDGKIISITSNGVDILEQFKDDNGKLRKENIKLTLPRKQ